MKAIDSLLIAYTAWLCRVLGVTPGGVNRVRVRDGAGFTPRPEGALGFYY